MKIQWLGQASFLLTLNGGKTIITDPFQEIGYPIPGIAADIVTVSHQHRDHNGVENVPGKPYIIRNEGVYSFEEIIITGIHSYHDKSKGEQRGRNIIFVIETEGIRVCHLGDLGHFLETEHIEKIGKVDVLMVPVGGYYTISPDEAVKVVEELKPRYVLPMHYKTDYIKYPISGPEEFLKEFYGYCIEKELIITVDTVPGSLKTVLLSLKL